MQNLPDLDQNKPFHVQALDTAMMAFRLGKQLPVAVYVALAVALIGLFLLGKISNRVEDKQIVQEVANPVNDSRTFDPDIVIEGRLTEVEELERNLMAFEEQESRNLIIALADDFAVFAARELNNPDNTNCHDESLQHCLRSFLENRETQLGALTDESPIHERIKIFNEVRAIRLALAMSRPEEARNSAEQALYKSYVIDPFQVVEGQEVRVRLEDPKPRSQLLRAQIQMLQDAYAANATLEEQAELLMEERSDESN